MRPTFKSTVGAILRKDLLIELRAKESVPAMAIFAVSTLVVLHFALDRDTLSGDLAAGALWVALLFAAILGINRLFVADYEQGGMEGILLAPVDRSAVYVAKGLALLIYLLVLELVAVPAFALFFLDKNITEFLPSLLPVLALADLGLAAVGCLVAALTVHARARELLLPILMLPLMVPVVIAASNATGPLLSSTAEAAEMGKWLLVLGLFDTVFALLAYAVFDFLLED